MLTVMKRYRGIYAVLLGLLAAGAFLFASSHYEVNATVPAERIQSLPFAEEYYAAVNERFGVGLNPGITVSVNGMVRPALVTDYNINELRIGWYSDWRTNREPLRPGGIKYVQLILVRASVYPTNTLQLTETVAATPGSLWLIGNEPEGKYGQGNRTPQEYARIYHEMYTLIKGLDPTACIAIGGVIQPTPLRLQWLDLLLSEYENLFGEPMPVDVWNIHAQILQEKARDWGAEIPAGLSATEGRLYTLQDNADPDIFRQLVIEFRQWMKAKGFQDKPLIISEYGVLMPSTYIVEDGDADKGDQKIIDFMHQTFNFLVNAKDPDLGYPADDDRLVQQWLWYSLNDQPYDPATGLGFNGSLFSHQDPTQMTKFGLAFRDYMNTLLGSKIMLPVVMRRAPTHRGTSDGGGSWYLLRKRLKGRGDGTTCSWLSCCSYWLPCWSKAY
ncbi:MAG: hypothetical protein H5T64_11895 [Chloroflexi bacterium]|nr:hypothetical protein [Chloroflexota bacterium]